MLLNLLCQVLYVYNKAINRQRFSMLSTIFGHDWVVSSTQKRFRARDAVECSNVFLSAGSNPGVLKNSTKHAEPFLLRIDNSHVTSHCFPSVRILSTSENQSNCEKLVKNCVTCNQR